MVAASSSEAADPPPSAPGTGGGAKGEGGSFVQGGRIAPGGALPVNTNGGGLSCVHPGMYGLYTVIEAVRQLRGGCGERQVPDAKVGVAHGNGGVLSSQVTSVWGNAAAL